MILALLTSLAALPASASWVDDPVWHDGLVEKAVYDASRVIYGRPRAYTAVIFTNKEQHDLGTLTKASTSAQTLEVFKHHHLEVVPTPNYDYKFATASHLSVEGLRLTRLEASSQEFCGASFKQFELRPGSSRLSFHAFSYMPEAGVEKGEVEVGDAPLVPFDALPLWLRGYDFAARPTVAIQLLPGQKSNRATPTRPVAAEIRYAGDEPDAHVLQLAQGGRVLGAFRMARDRLHVMVGYDGADGVTYRLRSVERTDYWTLRE